MYLFSYCLYFARRHILFGWHIKLNTCYAVTPILYLRRLCVYWHIHLGFLQLANLKHCDYHIFNPPTQSECIKWLVLLNVLNLTGSHCSVHSPLSAWAGLCPSPLSEWAPVWSSQTSGCLCFWSCTVGGQKQSGVTVVTVRCYRRAHCRCFITKQLVQSI